LLNENYNLSNIQGEDNYEYLLHRRIRPPHKRTAKSLPLL
jgi:hypothetical protein